MNPLLLSGFGISINVDKRKLVIVNKLENNEKYEFYPHQITYDSIIIDGHTGYISFEAIRWLMKHDIPLIMLNWNGNLLGVTLPQGPKSGKLRIKQYQKYLDNKIRINIAEEIVNCKIKLIFNLLRELANYYSEININLIEKLFQNGKTDYGVLKLRIISEANYDISQTKRFISNTLMNHEGRIATIYWQYLTKIFHKLYPQFNFQNRKNKSHSWNNNASDEVNALLNYGYAILEAEIRKCINAIGLDSSIGFLHEIAESKTPLVYDIQELFRWLIDLSVIELLEEKKLLKKGNFIVTENYHIRLKENTANLLVDKIKNNFNRKAENYKRSKSYSYKNILFDNVQLLANFIMDKNNKIQFNIPIIKMQKSDYNYFAIQKRIMSMTTEERKRLGINKSTLWYQKNSLSKGHRVRLYDKVLSKLIL
jgi:CRISPR-associated protein Cas1